MTTPIQLPMFEQQTTMPSVQAPVDATAAALGPSDELQALFDWAEAQRPPGAFEQVHETLRHIKQRGLMIVPDVAVGLARDIMKIIGVTSEELQHPEIQERLRKIGLDPKALAPIAAVTDAVLGESAQPGGRLKAGGRLAAMVAGFGAAGVARGAIGKVTTLPGYLGRGIVEGTAFGTTTGMLTPLEENQTRAGNVLTFNTIGVPLVTLGGIASYGAQRFLSARGIKPQLEVPEVAPTTAEFNPIAAVRSNSPLFTSGKFMGGRMARGAAEAEARTAQPGRLAAAAEEVAPRGSVRLWDRVTSERGAIDLRPKQVPLTPAEQSIMGAISVGGREKRIPYTWDKFVTEYLDDLHPINIAVKELNEMLGSKRAQVPGIRMTPLRDPYVLARLSRGSIGKANAMLESGVLDWKTLQPVTQGLREILRPVAEKGMLDQLRVYLDARHGVNLVDTQGLKIPFKYSEAKVVIENATPVIRQAAESIDRYQGALRKYMVDSGIWSPEMSLQMEQMNPAYVPFYRFIEEPRPFLQYPGGPSVGGKRMANLPTGTRRARGGETAQLVDPLENIVRNTYAFTQLADRHAVGEALVKMAEGVARREGVPLKESSASSIVTPARPTIRPIRLSPGEMKKAQANLREFTEILDRQSGVSGGELELSAFAGDMMTIFRPRETLGDGIISVWRGGKRKHYSVDPELYSAMLDLGREQSNRLIRFLAAPARVLRAGATLSPRFIARNPLRDQFTASIFSRYGFKPGLDLGRGIFHVIERDRLFQQFQRSGAEHATLVRSTGAERRALQRTLSDLTNRGGVLADAGRVVTHPIEGLRALSEAMETASRSQEFARAMAKTGDPRLAAFAAREVTLDFSRMGTHMRVLNQIIPFLNANVQGVDKLFRSFKERPVVTSALAAGYITLPTLALYMLNHDDPIYNELSSARRDFYWNVSIPRWNAEQGRIERSGEFISIPKPFDAGLIAGAYPERVAEWIKTNDPEAFEDLRTNILESFIPGVLPTAIAPAIQAITGYEFFRGRPIVPEREKRLLPAYQAGPFQGETVRLVGKALGVSPRIVESVIRGHTGGLGEGVLATVDLILDGLGTQEGPIEPRTPLERTPLIGPMASQFLTREPTISSRSVSQFFQHWEEIDATMNTVRSLVTEGRAIEANRLATGSRAEIASYQIFSQSAESMSKVMKAIRGVRSSRELDREQREERLKILGRVYRTIAGNALEARKRLMQNLEAPIPLSPFLFPADSSVPLGGDPKDGVIREEELRP